MRHILGGGKNRKQNLAKSITKMFQLIGKPNGAELLVRGRHVGYGISSHPNGKGIHTPIM